MDNDATFDPTNFIPTRNNIASQLRRFEATLDALMEDSRLTQEQQFTLAAVGGIVHALADGAELAPEASGPDLAREYLKTLLGKLK
ncbi:MAG TPA: hypothetical protein VIY48_06060 [Candidatus Paceibacterota bacterium]